MTYQATTPQARSTSAISTVATIEITSDPKHPILFEVQTNHVSSRRECGAPSR